MKRTYVRNITESRAVRLFSESFGTDLKTRFEKFKEEVNEFYDEVESLLSIAERNSSSPSEVEKLLLFKIKDEGSDVQGTFTHLMSLFGLYQQEMLDNCTDKVNGRKKDLNYKR